MSHLSRIVLATVVAIASLAPAQAPAPPPVPSQFASAKTMFLANAGAASIGMRAKEASTMLYTNAYRELSARSGYTLTSNPAGADLLAEISIQVTTDATNGSSLGTGIIRLAVYDKKTHALLWTVEEVVGGAFRQKTFDKNIREAMTKISADLQSLAAGQLP